MPAVQACASTLGALQHPQSVKTVIHLWRNDPISSVREASLGDVPWRLIRRCIHRPFRIMGVIVPQLGGKLSLALPQAAHAALLSIGGTIEDRQDGDVPSIAEEVQVCRRDLSDL